MICEYCCWQWCWWVRSNDLSQRFVKTPIQGVKSLKWVFPQMCYPINSFIFVYLCEWWICRLDEYIQIAYFKWFYLILKINCILLIFQNASLSPIAGAWDRWPQHNSHMLQCIYGILPLFLSHRIGPKVKTI